MEAIKAFIGSIPMAFIVIGVGLLILWVIVIGLGSLIAGWGKGEKKVKVPKAPKASDHGHKDHSSGHDHHDKKSGPLSFAVAVLIIVVALVAGYWLFTTIANWDRGNRDHMMARRYLFYAPASAVTSDMPAPAPPESIDCKGDDLAAAIIAPGEAAIVRTVPGTRFSFKPDTSDGTITACDYYNRSVCSSATQTRTIATNAFLVTNVSGAPVAFYCTHRQP